MKKFICFSLVALAFNSYAEVEECSWENKSKYQVESCLADLVEERKSELKVVLAQVNAVVVGQEEYKVAPDLTKVFQKNSQDFENYKNSFCNLYLGATGANMGTGSYSTALECEAKVLKQRIQLLRIIAN
ncbi:ribose-5-phosphate isomerase [Shewanella sp. Actino-trap-3]|jgi:uncharacterized protein YecT (DUF1311 family)|uniref:lysozyme inhibitor LprI family protein n=1 Tax=Shewanella sp. Actino-trap-3 TaxID=2058331 RepID=UPI000C325F06|nr:lysozyme inhibitor LprI family protein [Shewanella sp. Actino-trap-3]PKG77085.1 ribose-5-phosphate isomerase [Shewanella sp. Actino-trap-3]